MSEKNTLLELGALWASKPDADSIMSGTINNNIRIIIVKNKYKQSDRHPDYKILLTKNDEWKKKKDQPQQGQQQPYTPQFNENDIPL